MWPRTRSLVRVEQRLRGRRPGEEQEDEYRRPTDDLASLCISDSPPQIPSLSLPFFFPTPTSPSLFSFLSAPFFPRYRGYDFGYSRDRVWMNTVRMIRSFARVNRTSKYISMDFIILAIRQIGHFLSTLLKRAMNSWVRTKFFRPAFDGFYNSGKPRELSIDPFETKAMNS